MILLGVLVVLWLENIEFSLTKRRSSYCDQPAYKIPYIKNGRCSFCRNCQARLIANAKPLYLPILSSTGASAAFHLGGGRASRRYLVKETFAAPKHDSESSQGCSPYIIR